MKHPCLGWSQLAFAFFVLGRFADHLTRFGRSGALGSGFLGHSFQASKEMHYIQVGLALVFARLTWLAATCPCEPLFACHAAETVTLVTLGAVGVGASLAGLIPTSQ